MKVEHQQAGSVDVLKPVGALVDVDAETFARVLLERVKSSNPRVVIALHEVPYLDSVAIEHLLTASGQLDLGALELGADYRFASAFDKVQVFTDPRLDAVVPTRVLDGHLSYRIGDQILRLQVDNALNYSYTTIERNLEPIRRYTISLEIAF